MSPNKFFAGEEEMGKKNDDFRPTKRSSMSKSIAHTWRGPRRNRLLLGLLCFGFLYIFWKNIPTDLPSVGQRGDPRFRRPPPPPAPAFIPGLKSNDEGSDGLPPEEGRVAPDASVDHYYEGQIRFFKLAETLSIGANYHGTSPVVWVISSLKSLSVVAPLACAMAVQRLNNVHLLIVGRDTIPMKKLKEINGIDAKHCPVLWHDGRPNYSMYSTDLRMQVAAKAALGHFNTIMHPKAVIVDGSSTEDTWFLHAMKVKTAESGLSLIQLPWNPVMELDYLSRLDASSLQAWNTVEFEILVHAQPGASGSLIRLLRSIADADYTAGTYPKLTVELPNIIDEPTRRFLENFAWPPKTKGGIVPESKLTLRHRISNNLESPEAASLRFIESFYPSQSSMSHVIVLSPQAELSPSYFHYLKFLVLKYKYSSSGFTSASLLGISLDMPEHALDGKSAVHVPKKPISNPSAPKQSKKPPEFALWLAPNSNAALYFGDKWLELHAFFSHRLKVSARAKNTGTETPAVKAVSEKYPAWLEYIAELASCRGYTMLYPAFAAKTDISVATIHTELYKPPAEFTKKKTNSDHEDSSTPLDITPQTTLDAPFEASQARGAQLAAERPLHQFSTFLLSLFDVHDTDDVPPLTSLPLMAFDGNEMTAEAMGATTVAYLDKFLVEKGGCKSPESRPAIVTLDNDAKDLFCLDD